VIVYNTAKVGSPPSRLADLTGAEWRGRVAMARPEFGTTRGQMAMLYDVWGPDAFRAWLEGLKDNGLRLYDGNSAVVRGVAYGEADVGLTDTDDVWSGQRNGWPVELRYEARDPAANPPSPGPMPIPNTVARVRGGPNPEGAASLINFLLGERVERMLASSESGNTPLRPAVAAEFADRAVPEPAAVDLARVAAAVPGAMEVCRAVLG
jgi:iron(III) transport system substrate-binding protein